MSSNMDYFCLGLAIAFFNVRLRCPRLRLPPLASSSVASFGMAVSAQHRLCFRPYFQPPATFRICIQSREPKLDSSSPQGNYLRDT